MRVAVFYNTAGGAKRAIYEMTKGLAKRGHVLVEVVPSTAELEWCSLMPHVKSRKVWSLYWPQWNRRIPFVTPYLHLATAVLGAVRYHLLSRRMAQWLESQSFDILFANDCSLLLNPPIAGYAGIPTLLYVHHGSHLSCHSIDNDPRTQTNASLKDRAKRVYYAPATKLWDMLRYESERWAARQAGAIACNSTIAQQLIKQAYGVESHVIHYGVDTEAFRPVAGGVVRDYVLSAGAITPHKSFGFLVEALATIPKQHRPSLRIASAHSRTDEVDRLMKLAQSREVEVAIVRPRSDQDLVRLYSEAKAFLFAAHREAFGLVVLEAMACGTPVVGVEDGGYTDAIINGINGFVTSRNPKAFGEAVLRLLDTPRLRDEMGQQAQEHVTAHWTWERAVTNLEQCLCVVSKGHEPAIWNC